MFRIRPLEPGDLAEASRVIADALRAYDAFLPAAVRADQEDPAAVLADSGSGLRFWVALTDHGEIVGVMGLQPVADVVLIRHGYVRTDWQRRGVGAALLAHLEAQVPGGRRMIIGTYRQNAAARSHLEKHGYRVCEDSDAILGRYYRIADLQRAHSVAYAKYR
jgi:GNAT superfamily N-acetyltransferase